MTYNNFTIKAVTVKIYDINPNITGIILLPEYKQQQKIIISFLYEEHTFYTYLNIDEKITNNNITNRILFTVNDFISTISSRPSNWAILKNQLIFQNLFKNKTTMDKKQENTLTKITNAVIYIPADKLTKYLKFIEKNLFYNGKFIPKNISMTKLEFYLKELRTHGLLDTPVPRKEIIYKRD